MAFLKCPPWHAGGSIQMICLGALVFTNKWGRFGHHISSVHAHV